MSSEKMRGMMERKDMIDRLFLDYSSPKLALPNIKALSQLALIGGRLDVLIRRQATEDRPRATYRGKPVQA